MTTLLYITVSPQGDNSRSRGVAEAFLSTHKKMSPNTKIVTLDLNEHPVPHLDSETLIAGYVSEDQRTPSQKKKHQYRLGLIDQIVKADEILLASPMWNWNVPSVLKAYIDQLIVPGFFDNNTKKLAGKKVTVALACGGSYSPDSWHPEWDYETGYLKHIFTALGSTDVEVIRTEWCLAGIVPGMEAYTALKEESFRDAKIAAQKRAQSTTASSKSAATQKQQHQQQEFYEVGCSCVIA